MALRVCRRASRRSNAAFGYVVANRVIGASLWSALAQAQGVSLRVPATPEAVEIGPERVSLTLVDAAGARECISTSVVVAADGAHSTVRAAAGIDAAVEDYGRLRSSAMSQRIAPMMAPPTSASRPAVRLPCYPCTTKPSPRMRTVAASLAARFLQLPEGRFLAELQARFGWRAGRFVRVGRRASYPLKLTRAARPSARVPSSSAMLRRRCTRLPGRAST